MSKTSIGEKYMESLWGQTWVQPSFPVQAGDLNTDVLIIGGGMAGILCA